MQNNFEITSRVSHGRDLLKHVWKHFEEDRCFDEAASLGYTSLLALVPLLAVIFGIISVFPVFSEWSDQLQDFIFDNMIPAAGETIVPHLDNFLDSISSLTLPGTVMLIITALMLMVRIEVAFNRIWRVPQSRSVISRITMYWAVLTLAPIMIGAAVALSAQNILAAFTTGGEVPLWLYRTGIFALSWLVFATVFLLVPNRAVRIQHALIGAGLSAVLFELAKLGFVAFVSNTNYKVIYGALATIPIFLMWLYLVWIVVLFGASLAASLTTFRARTREGGEWPDTWMFQLVYRLLGHLWEAQRKGRSLSESELMALEQHVSEFQLVGLLGRLQEAGLVTREEGGDWMLAMDLGEVTLADLYRMLEMYVPASELDQLPVVLEWDKAYVRTLQSISKSASDLWQQSLRSMYRAHTKGENT